MKLGFAMLFCGSVIIGYGASGMEGVLYAAGSVLAFVGFLICTHEMGV